VVRRRRDVSKIVDCAAEANLIGQIPDERTEKEWAIDDGKAGREGGCT
jgi:hypothetical protein